MGRPRFRGRSQRAATGPPQETRSPWRPVVDLTGDALPFNASAPNRMALPLGPASGYRTNSTSIEVPLDPKQSPAYLFQQMALIRNRARNQPSFSSIVRPRPDIDSGTSSELGPEDKENTPTPTNSRRPKGKPEKSSRVASKASVAPDGHQEKQKTSSSKKGHREASSEFQERHTNRGRDKTGSEEDGDGENISDPAVGEESSARPRKRAKSKSKPKSKKTKDKGDAGIQQGEEEGENGQNNVEAENATFGTKTGTKARKRKRGYESTTEAQNSSSAEPKALKQLREILPSKRVSRVEHQLRQEMAGGAGPPTEMTVVVTAARDTIIDLARQQVVQTERSYQAIQAELLRMLKEQNKKLARWERRAKTTIGLLGSSNEPDSDSDAVFVVGSSSSSDENGCEAAREEAEDEAEPEVEADSEEDEAPKRKKKKKNKKKDEKNDKKRKHRSVSPVSIRRRRRAATEDPNPRSSCQSGVQ